MFQLHLPQNLTVDFPLMWTLPLDLQNETQYQLSGLIMSSVINTDDLCNKLRNNNVFTIAKRNVEGQDMLYQSVKLTNGIWILAELKVTPNAPLTLSLKSKTTDVISSVKEAYELVLQSN
jgi:hypothetical protein